MKTIYKDYDEWLESKKINSLSLDTIKMEIVWDARQPEIDELKYELDRARAINDAREMLEEVIERLKIMVNTVKNL